MYRNNDKLDVGSLRVSFEMFTVCNKDKQKTKLKTLL